MLNYSTQDVASLLTAQGEDPAKYDLNGLTDAYNNPTKYPGFIQQQQTQSQAPLTSPQAPGIAETAARVAGRNIIPTVGGGIGYTGGSMLGGALAGLLTGGAEGSIVPGIGNVVGGVTGAIGGGLLASKLQEKALQGIQSPEDYQTGIQAQQSGSEANPKTAFLAGVAPMLLMGRPGVGLDIANRLKGAALMGGTDLASQAIVNGTPLSDINYGDIVKSAATGALFNKPQLLGNSRLFGGSSYGEQLNEQAEQPLTSPISGNKTTPIVTSAIIPKTSDNPIQPVGETSTKAAAETSDILPPTTPVTKETLAEETPAELLKQAQAEGSLYQYPKPTTKEYGQAWNTWTQHSIDYGQAISQKYPSTLNQYKSLGYSNEDSIEAVGKTFIEALAKKEPLAQKMLSSLHESGLMPVEGSIDKANSAISNYNTVREVNSYKRLTQQKSYINELLKDNPQFQQHTKDLANKIGVDVQRVEGLQDANGNDVAGAAYIKDRIMQLNPKKAGLDTGLHELNHFFFRDMLESSNPTDRALVNEGINLHGSEEAAVEHLGLSDVKQLQAEALAGNKPVGWVDKAIQWAQNMWRQIKFKFNSASPEDIAQMLQARRKSFYEDPNHPIGKEWAISPLLQDKSNIVKDEDKNNPLIRSKIGLPPSKLAKNQVSNINGKDLLANEKGSIQAERPTPSFALTRPAIEQVAKEEGNNTLSNSLSEAFKRQHEIEGQFTSQIPTALKLSHKEDLELEKLLQAGANDNKDYSNYATSPKIAQAYKEARAMYDSVFQYANSTGKYIMDEGGPRDMNKVSNYHVQAGSPDLNSNLTKNPTGENSKAYLNDYYQHRLSKGDTIETAQKDLEGYKAKFQPQALGGPGQTVMGAVRYPLGKTLPDSWDEPSALVKLKSYIQRTSKDFAWRESIESNPLIAKRIGYNDIVVKNPTTGAYETHSLKDVPVDKTNSQAAKTVFESFRGTHEAGEEIPNALGRLATSVTLGPLTGIHIAVSSAFKAMSYARPSELLDASKSMMKVDQGQIHAIENGVARGDIVGTAGDHIDTMNGIARNLNNLADLVGKITGRSHLTLWSQGGAQSVGEFLTRQRIMQAKGGDREAAVFLNKLDPSFDYNKPLDNNIISKLGSQFVNLIHGSNDARTQPTWMLKEGFVAPFFKLMSWSVGQTNAFMKHVYEPASTYVKTGGKEGDYVPMIMATMGGVLGGAFIKYLREEVSGKEGPIPTLKEMVNDGKGFEDNIPIAAYQAMAYASYAGLAGVFSSIGKAGFDFAYKNKAQGAMFPLDEIISNSVKTGSDYFTAMINGDKSQWGQMTTHALMDYLNQNIQMSRIAMNHLAQSGISSELQNKYKVAVANRNLRAYEEVKGLPYQQQEASEANPYTEIGQKLFKQESNPAKAMQELPELIHDIFNRYGNQWVDVLRNKLAALKINNYRTIPSPENEPLTSMKYMDFVRRTQGTQAANNLFGDYMRQNLINKIKGSMVPQL